MVGILYLNGVHHIGNIVLRWLKGHFITGYANNFKIGNGTGMPRRFLLEGDLIEFAYNDLTEKPDLLQGEKGPPGPPGPTGVTPDAPGYVATPTYESNTLTNEDCDVENLSDPQTGT